MQTGLTASLTFEVSGGDTARALGSGDLEVEATDAADGASLGGGEVTRAVVDRERFLARLAGR